jgi:hypothetical protein
LRVLALEASQLDDSWADPSPPHDLTDHELAKWNKEQEAKQARRHEEGERRRQEAQDKFRAAMDEHIDRALSTRLHDCREP